MQIPNNIHIIWFGSFLRDAHQERIRAWRSFNPKHNVYVWINRDVINPQTYDQFVKFCNDYDLSLCDIDILYSDMQEATSTWIREQLWRRGNSEAQNYGVLSDVYRFFILQYAGGWYFDTDIIPTFPLPIDVSLKYGFAICGCINVRTKSVSKLQPSVLLSNQDNAFISISIQYLNKLASNKHFTELAEQAFYSSDVCTRVVATNWSTGSIFCYALTKIIVGCDFILAWSDNTLSYRFSDVDVFISVGLLQLGLGYSFTITEELSWFCRPRHASSNFELRAGLLDAWKLYQWWRGERATPQLSIDLKAVICKETENIDDIRLPSLSRLSLNSGPKLTFFTNQTIALPSGVTKARCLSV